MSKHILIIEDDESIGKAFELILTQEGYKVTLAVSGKAGIEAAQSQKPDLILLDVMLPDTTGWEIFGLLNADKKTAKIPVIVQSNLYSSERETEFLSAGAKEYLLKAKLDAPTLVAKVKENLSE